MLSVHTKVVVCMLIMKGESGYIRLMLSFSLICLSFLYFYLPYTKVAQTAQISLRQPFFESTMRNTMARLKNSHCYNSPETCPTAVNPQLSQTADGTL